MWRKNLRKETYNRCEVGTLEHKISRQDAKDVHLKWNVLCSSWCIHKNGLQKASLRSVRRRGGQKVLLELVLRSGGGQTQSYQQF